MPSNQQPTPDVPLGWPVEPEYTRPAWLLAPQNAPMQPYGGQQPIIVHNHYAAPRRGPDAGQVFGWVAVGGVVAGVLLAVAAVAVALGLAASPWPFSRSSSAQSGGTSRAASSRRPRPTRQPVEQGR